MIESQQIEVIKDEWLTKAAQINCYNVPDQILNSKSYLGNFIGPTLLTAKINSNEKTKIQALLNIGFELWDTNLKFEILGCNIIDKQDAKTNENIQVDFIKEKFEAQREQLEEIAKESLTFSRFNYDVNLPLGCAQKIKANWARDIYEGKRGDGLLLALDGNQVVGFLGFMKNSKNLDSYQIDLFAVKSDQQQKKIGTKLLRGFNDFLLNNNYLGIAGTSLLNYPAINLYISFGYKIKGSQQILHYYTGD
jgi:ribosomal protein S18 acetylase RimI-like enzyme